jgi:ABC-type transport system substrate-binding protein
VCGVVFSKKQTIRRNMFFILIVTCFFAAKPILSQPAFVPFFTLITKTYAENKFYDNTRMIKQHLERIGIEVILIGLTWTEFIGELLNLHGFDLFYVGFGQGEADPDWTGVYSEGAALNSFGYNQSMDWEEELGMGKNEWYIQEGRRMMPPHSPERIQHYWDWEQHLMAKILPLKPMFSPFNSIASWSNLQGYDGEEGLKICWGKLSWDGLHLGQEDSSEIVVAAEDIEIDYNPLYESSMKGTIPYYIFDSLFTYDQDVNYFPHLAYDWEMLSDTQIRVYLRQGIKWQADPEGLFLNEYFDADDVVFSYYAWKYISNAWNDFYWLEDIKKVDQYTVDFYIDEEPDTPEKEPYAGIFRYFVKPILPEHYLNQTQLEDGITPDYTDQSWIDFSVHSFGTSLFELDKYNDVEINLKLNEDSWFLDPLVNKTGMDFENRFGDYSGGITKLKIWQVPYFDGRVHAFKLGQLDLVSLSSNYILADEFEKESNYKVYYYKPFFFDFLGFNIRESRGPLGNQTAAPGNSDITVGLALRKAISYAIDRNEINRISFSGRSDLTDWPFYPGMGIWCNPDIIRYNYDLDEARRYMRIAGYGEEIVPPGFSPLEIAGIVISSVIVAGAFSFVIYWLYRRSK